MCPLGEDVIPKQLKTTLNRLKFSRSSVRWKMFEDCNLSEGIMLLLIISGPHTSLIARWLKHLIKMSKQPVPITCQGANYMCSSVHKSANINFIMNRGCGNIARTNLINRLLFYALYGDKIIASEGYMRVYSNRDDLGACSNNLLNINLFELSNCQRETINSLVDSELRTGSR